MPSVLLSLISVIVTLGVSRAHGQGRTCDFPEIKHGNIYEEHRYKQTFPVATGKYFYYSCDRSFASPSRSLWTRITCTEEGWLPTPKCLRQCFFPWVENGQSASSGQTHQEGDSVQGVCDEGYSLPLNQSGITCAESGWSAPPTCSRTGSRRKCGPPPTIDNGDITTFPSAVYAPGDSVEYKCQAFYRLQGNRIVTCSDGKWSEPPKCLESEEKCGPPPTINNGDITTFSSAVYAPGDSVEYKCQAFYRLRGNRIVTCSDGKWSEPPKCLEVCVVSEEMMRKHNIRLKWRRDTRLYLESDDILEFECRYRYRARSPPSAFQVTCQEGKLTYPTCG